MSLFIIRNGLSDQLCIFETGVRINTRINRINFLLNNSSRNLSTFLLSAVSSDSDSKETVFFSTDSSVPCTPNAFLVSLTIFLYIASYSRFAFPFTFSLSWSISYIFFWIKSHLCLSIWHFLSLITSSNLSLTILFIIRYSTDSTNWLNF